MGGPDPNRGPRNMFKKRGYTLMKKGDELANLTGAKVYILIENPLGVILYNSNGKHNPPPPDFVLETLYENVKRMDTDDIKKSDKSARELPDESEDNIEQDSKQGAREGIIVPRAPDLLMSTSDKGCDFA